MKNPRKFLFWLVFDLAFSAALIYGGVRIVKHDQLMAAQLQTVAVPAPPPVPAPAPTANPQYVAALDVARVFGRAAGCMDASPDLITAVANEAVDSKLDARIFAATIATESACNPYAVSTKGAIGLTQIVPRVWKDTYDFSRQYNVLNRADNLHVGASILAAFIKQYGRDSGIRRFNGLGTDCTTCDATYPNKILTLAGMK